MKVDRLTGRLLDALAVLSAIVLLAMVVVVCADVLLRNVGTQGLPWSNEANEYGLYLATVVAAPWLLRRGQHVRIDIALSAVPPRVGWLLEWLGDGVGLAVCAVLCVFGTVNVVESLRQGSLVIKTLVFPEWWLLAPLPIAFALLALEFVLRMVRLAAGERAPRREAVSIA